MEKEILLCGSSGYIGSALVNSDLNKEYNLIPISSKQYNFLDENDLLRAFERNKEKEKIIIFLSTINKYVENNFESYNKNLQIVKSLIAAQSRIKISKIIFFSSVDVYGEPKILPLTESSEINPDTWYGKAKYESEELLVNSSLVDQGKLAILRLPGVFGKGISEKSAIGKMLNMALEKKEIILNSNSRIKRDFLFVFDLVALIEEMIISDFAGIINVASGNALSLEEIAKEICLSVNRNKQIDVQIKKQEIKNDRDFDLIFDVSLLRKYFPNFKFTALSTAVDSYFILN